MTALLEGRTALVTGGTVGIGRGIAETLLSHGATVAVTGVTDDEVAAARADSLTAYRLDVRSRDSCEDVMAAFLAEHDGLDLLSSNAGVYPQARLEEMSDEDLEDIFAINVFGTVHIIQAALPALRRSPAGRIVVTSSITGNHTGFPAWSHYGATKAAQMGFVRSAALELAADGITINAVLPGNVLTPGLKAMGEGYLRQMAAAVPLGYLGDPADIGHTVAFLGSDGARYITGQGIVVDGGQILPESPEALAEM